MTAAAHTDPEAARLLEELAVRFADREQVRAAARLSAAEIVAEHEECIGVLLEQLGERGWSVRQVAVHLGVSVHILHRLLAVAPDHQPRSSPLVRRRPKDGV